MFSADGTCRQSPFCVGLLFQKSVWNGYCIPLLVPLIKVKVAQEANMAPCNSRHLKNPFATFFAEPFITLPKLYSLLTWTFGVRRRRNCTIPTLFFLNIATINPHFLVIFLVLKNFFKSPGNTTFCFYNRLCQAIIKDHTVSYQLPILLVFLKQASFW